ncbi:undecaprenyl-phosphate glucose phosphotransferase [uncultured Rhodoblastus sp.]|uniref:undecaprenyl-phosphate glucose phosphotransferase n=1 Tax=uncultured Rhodoblastus sp. TaxID=543037 RepID=UPI0025F84662|nr:undecaprenyl-phosphate glucose phosphotransferase [uncultured Rhodoblastus sp.]
MFAAGADILIVIVAALISGSLFHFTDSETESEVSRNMAGAVFVAVLFVGSMWARKLYEPPRLIEFGDQVRGLLGTWCGAFLLLASGVFTWGVGKELSRETIWSFWAIGGAALLVHRQLWRIYLPRALANGAIKGRKAVIIVWDEPQSGKSSNLLLRHGYLVFKIFQLGPSAEDSAATLEEVIAFVRGQDIDDIFLAPRAGSIVDLVAAATALRALPISVTMLPDPVLADLVSNPRYELGSSIALEIQRQPLGLGERAAKRAFDIVVAATALVLLAPLLGLVALAIKLDSPGPVFFRQTRSGFNGRPFKIFKFRSMTVAEDGEKVGQATKNDKRVTRLGGFLRKSSLDELPQLFNVLRGEMSVVGPRPHAMAHDKEFAEYAYNYVFRHHVKAGMTGWAQVHGARGETDTVEKIQRRVDLDLWYVKHWSLALDFSILFRTVIVVLHGKNAY